MTDVPAPLQRQPHPQTGMTIVPARRMRGAAFSWDHEIRVALPASYDASTNAYPVLWVTDGGWLFEAALQSLFFSSQFGLPEMIVVAIGEPPEDAASLGLRRAHEFYAHERPGFDGFGSTLFEAHAEPLEAAMSAAAGGLRFGGADKFLTYLIEEVRPVLQSTYRMAASHTLFGDSAGGHFCAYAMLTKPEAFDRYICGSPVLRAGNEEIFRLEAAYAETHSDLPARIFLGAGENEAQEGGMISAWGCASSTMRLGELLKLRGYPSLRMKIRVFPGEDHLSAIPMTLSHGLRWAWAHD